MRVERYRRLDLVSQVMGAIDVKQTSETELMLEWIASASNDMVADSVIAVLMGIDSSPASVKCGCEV